MKTDGVHKMINKAKLRAMLLQLEALSVAESNRHLSITSRHRAPRS
jgi:hypothetical protein